MEVFLLGGLCLIVGLLVSWFTNVDWRALGWYILLLPFIVIFVAGLYNIPTAHPTTLNIIASATVRSITSNFLEYLLYGLGGYIAGALIGFLTPGHS